MPTRGSLNPLSPRVLLANTAPNIIDYASGCGSIVERVPAADWQAPSRYSRLSSLGTVYRQVYTVQCTVSYPGKGIRRGRPKQVVLCWPGKIQPGLRSKEIIPGRPGIQNPVWVSCSCNYFRYVCEWALTRYGSSDIVYSNGQPARFTNPRGIGTLCKHVYVAIQHSIDNWTEEAPKERAVEEPAVEELPELPQDLPEGELEKVLPLPDLEEQEEDDQELQKHSKYVAAAANLRSIALSFDTECC